MKIFIGGSEEYPVVRLEIDEDNLTTCGSEIDMDEADYEQYKRIAAAWDAMQAKLRPICRAADKARWKGYSANRQ